MHRDDRYTNTEADAGSYEQSWTPQPDPPDAAELHTDPPKSGPPPGWVEQRAWRAHRMLGGW